MECAYRVDQAVARGLEPVAVDKPGMRLRDGDHGRLRSGRGDLRFANAGQRLHVMKRQPEGSFAHQEREARGQIAGRQYVEARGRIVGLPVTVAADIEHHAAANRHHGREHADDEPVEGQQQCGFSEHDASVAGAAGRERHDMSEQAHFGFDFRSTGVEVNGRAMLQRLGRGKHLDTAIDVGDGAEQPGLGKHIATGELGGFDIGEVEGGALAGDGVVRFHSMNLDAAHAQTPAGRIDFDLLFFTNGAGDQRPGDDRAEAFDREHAIDGQAEVTGGIAIGSRRAGTRERLPELFEASSGDRAHGHDGSLFKERTRHELGGFEPDEVEEVGVDHVGLGEGDDAARNAEQPADVEVLAGLRLDGFIGGDDEEYEIDAADTREHVFHEALMARNIDEAETEGWSELEVGEAKIDGDAAALFFLEAVGVDAGERFHQRGLAVVDVACGSDDDVLHATCYSVDVLVVPLLALLTGSLVYCVLTVIAAVRYRAIRPSKPADFIPISILKPLSGVDEGLEQNLRSFFAQKYPAFELLFAVRRADDPAISVVEKLRTEFAGIPSRLIVTGEPPYANAKVFSLDRMLGAAEHDVLVMSDSDIRVTPDMLWTVAAEFADEKLGLATCPYRAVPGRSFWSMLEAIGLNTEFLGGVLVARMLDGMKFALGPTIVARRRTLERIGGFPALKDYLAEDFVMGKLAAESGDGVILSSYVIEHRIGAQDLAHNFKHRMRWNRSTRRSRPWGYIGQVFTNPLPLALLLWAAAPAWWPVVALTAMFRGAAGWATAGLVLRDPLVGRNWWLVPLQDVLSFVVWAAGFFGNTIIWRGHRYYLLPDGRFEPLQ
jgi:ceramide glucosyltransferase